MKDKRLFGRLRGLFGRKRGKKNKNATGKTSRTRNEPVIVHNTKELQAQDANLKQVIESSTPEDLRATADAQALSSFFQRLPVEIRLKIYHHVWRNYLKPRRVGPSTAGSNLRLHIYTPAPASQELTHARCTIHPGEPGQKDVLVTQDIQSEDWPSTPAWYRDAWVLRLNWGKHWKCQHAIQQQWNQTSKSGGAGSSLLATGAPTAPFLPLFLACKRMYLEAAQSLFETVTLVFTSSTDAHHFFMARRPQPHPFLPRLRHLELSLAYTNDHLFLSRVLHDNPPRPSTGGSHQDVNDNHDDDDDDAWPSAGIVNDTLSRADMGQVQVRDARHSMARTRPRTRPTSVCFNLVCKLDRFGAELWPFLVGGIRAAAPMLRELDVEIGGRIERGGILGSFGVVVDEEAEAEAEAEGDGMGVGGSGEGWDRGEVLGMGMREEGSAAAVEDVKWKAEEGRLSRWILPGRLVVVFSGGTVKEGYVQAGKGLVRVEMDQE
ncbi:hypothetical protein N658DRAFT_561306 [Parathielavia hyrcaniae]|uniref:Uncharacterized protein n=1 Tax=Parathielavia hyrcaniae TaxID=113614 RepID=A0AAN6PX04_9PEZI|nr:hypothetical protein N658DRAFT_561306 [Parathielavia hyrcaniae]